MSKGASRLKGMKKMVEKVSYGNKIQTFIPAGMASIGPPLGPVLGQVSQILNRFLFIKRFNNNEFYFTKEY